MTNVFVGLVLTIYLYGILRIVPVSLHEWRTRRAGDTYDVEEDSDMLFAAFLVFCLVAWPVLAPGLLAQITKDSATKPPSP